ncbi:MAG: cusS 2 [Planctomycetaceae bacterium]|nr:cusS 2 [Planctomycetaceae bacterium]
MIRRLNIRWRLTFWFAAAMTVLLVIRSFWIYHMMERRLATITDVELNAKIDALEDLLRKKFELKDVKTSLERYADNQRDLQIEIESSEQDVLFRSHPGSQIGVDKVRNIQPDTTGRQYATNLSKDGDQRREVITVVPTSLGQVTVRISRSMQAERNEVWEFAMTLLKSLPMVILAAFGVGYLVSARALSPVDKMISTAKDITANRLDKRIDVPDTGDELARLAQTLNEMIDRLNTSFEEMRRFTADAAHDLRTPVTALRTEVEVSLMADQTVDDYRHSMQSVLEEAINLSRLAEQLLDLSHEDRGWNYDEQPKVRLDVILQSVREDLHKVAQQKQIRIDTQQVRPWTVKGDQVRLRRVFTNLLNNAIQYTPNGGCIWIEGTSTPETTTVVIADNGIGVPAEDLPHVFDRFRRVDQARNSQSGGTGLGLAICKSIVESHGGKIWMESTLGQGSRVYVKLCTSKSVGGQSIAE